MRVSTLVPIAVEAGWLIATGLVVLAAVCIAWAYVARRRDRERDGSSAQVRRIRVDGRYQPSEVHVPAGEPARLIFRREETAPSSETVTFPDLGISVTLPPFQDIAVDLPASEAGEHPFTGHVELLRGRIVVDRRREDMTRVVPTDQDRGFRPVAALRNKRNFVR